MRLSIALTLTTLTACSAPAPAPEAPAPSVVEAPAPVTSIAQAVVDSEDRSESDRALDAGRHPVELLEWATVQSGMSVGEMMSGSGYTVELLARAVGEDGQVFGVNSAYVLERFAEAPWSARLALPANSNVVRLDREFDDPFPDTVTGLDRVFSVLVYHDFVWMETDRAAMNADIFASLVSGGQYVVIDHSAEDGSLGRDVKTLHRIDQAMVKAEVEAAGFKHLDDNDFLRNPADTRDWSASPSAAAEKRGASDRFAMRFVKP